VLFELVQNDRVVGGIDEESTRRAVALYQKVSRGQIFTTDATTAEFVKLMENTFRDVNIALANEFAGIAERLGIEVHTAIEMANRHPRVSILRPGPGVGGHCIPVDPWFLANAAPEESLLIRCAREVNDAVPARLAAVAARAMERTGGKRVALLGVAYKADVDDARESPAFALRSELEKRGMQVKATDPHAARRAEMAGSLVPLEEAIADADCLILVTDHAEFKALDPSRIKDLTPARLVVDSRKALDAASWKQAGFRVIVLGDGRDLAERGPQ
jgi:UDP-N-acetyl-D-mannosaminuronic acid dehydrogenase